MYFPIAGIEVSPLVPPLVAFGVSFFASMGGISGAFLLLPFQMSVLGYTNPSVSATNHFYNVVAIPSGVFRYVREKRMVWPLTLAVAAGTLPGVFAGTFIRVLWLPDPRAFKLFAAFVLFYIGGKLVWDTWRGRTGLRAAPGGKDAARGGNFEVRVIEASLKRIRYEFQGETHGCPTMGIMTLSLVVGMVGGVYGIGGGAIIAPFFLSWYKLPIHTISGATLMGTFLTSGAGVLFYTLIAPLFPEQAISPDWGLGLLFGAGGFMGMYCGARLQKKIPAGAIRWALGAVILSTALKYVFEFFR